MFNNATLENIDMYSRHTKKKIQVLEKKPIEHKKLHKITHKYFQKHLTNIHKAKTMHMQSKIDTINPTTKYLHKYRKV